MLVVVIELWPRGDAARKRILGAACLANDGTGSKEEGHYKVSLSPWGEGREQKTVRVEGFPRLREGPWELLFRALSILSEQDRRKGGAP